MAIRVLIVNSYCSKNKGDAGIVEGTLNLLRATWPDCEIAVVSDFPDVDRERYDVEVLEQIGMRWTLPGWKHHGRATKLGWLFLHSLWVLAWVIFWRLFSRSLHGDRAFQKTLVAIAKADVVLSCGGGYMYGGTSLINSVTFFIRLFNVWVCKLLGRPTVIFGQSVGPFYDRLTAWCCRKTLDFSDLVLIREEHSLSLVKSWGVNAPVHLVADAAFLVDPSPPERIEHILAMERIGPDPLVGISVRDWSFHEAKDPTAARERYMETIAKVADHLVEIGAQVVFTPQVILEKLDDDRQMTMEIVKRCQSHKGISVIQGDYTCSELVGLYARMELFIGTRMHANIFALNGQVPTLGIGYQPKTMGIMKMLDWDDYVISINDVDFDLLWPTIGRMWIDRKHLSCCLEAKVRAVRELAWKSGDLIKPLVKAVKAS